jgi:lysophospholipase L1-like esterase
MRQRLIAFGDSITLGHWDESGGWIAHLRRSADTRVLASERTQYATVYNLGISSNTSRHVLGRYRTEVDARHDPTEDTDLFIVLAVGINDSAVEQGTQKHLVEAERYEANMRALVALSKQDADGRVLVIGLTPVDESRTRPVSFRRNREYHAAFIEQYNQIARQVARDGAVAFVDLLDGLQPHDGHWQDWDGVHLNSSAHRRAAELIETELGALGWGAVGQQSTAPPT